MARACLILGALTVLAAGCGQKGPLVLPDGDAAGTAAPPAASPSSDDDDEQAATGSAGATGRPTGNGTDGP